jgi:hypothetical protein
MTLAANDRYVSLSPAAGTTALAWDFRLTRQDGLAVIRTRAAVTATLTQGTDYEFLSGLGSAAGGTVTLTSASLAGDIYELVGLHPEERLSDHVPAQAIQAERLNGDADAQAIMLQEHRRDISRSVRVGYGQTPPSIAQDIATGDFLVMSNGRIGGATVASADFAAALAAASVSRKFDTIAQLIAITIPGGNPALMPAWVEVRGVELGMQYIGGGVFCWDAASTRAHNGGTVIQPTAFAGNPGRYIRVGNPLVVNPVEWGAVDDGEWRGGFHSPTGTDNRAIFQAIIDWLPRTEVERDGYLSAGTGSWGAIGDWTTAGAGTPRIWLPHHRTSLYGIAGTIDRDVTKGLIFTTGGSPRGAGFLSLNAITDRKRSNWIVDFHPSHTIYTTPQAGHAPTGNGNAIGLDGVVFMRGGFRAVGNQNFAAFFTGFGVYGAPGKPFDLVDGSDMPSTDRAFPGVFGGAYTFVSKSTSEFRMRTGNYEIVWRSVGTDFTYTGDVPAGGTFERVDIHNVVSGACAGLIALGQGSTCDLADYALAATKDTFDGAWLDDLGDTYVDYAGYKTGINVVHTIIEKFEVAHCHRGPVVRAGTYALIRMRDFTVRSVWGPSLTLDSYGIEVSNYHLMGVIDNTAPHIHFPCTRSALAHAVLRKGNLGAEGGADPYSDPYFNEPDANDEEWGGDPKPGTSEWKYHPALTGIVIGPRDPITGAVTPVAVAPSLGGVAHVSFESLDASGSTHADTEYLVDIAVGAPENIRFTDTSAALYRKGIVKESAVAAGFAPAVNCSWDASNVIDGATCCTAVPAGDQPVFSKGGQGWASGISARTSVGRRARKGGLLDLSKGLNDFSNASKWTLSNVTVAKNATDRKADATGAWTLTRGAGATATLTTVGLSASQAAALALWIKEGTGAQKPLRWRAHKTGAAAHRYTPQSGFIVPDATWRKMLLPVHTADVAAGITFVIDMSAYAETETVLIDDHTRAWNTDDPPDYPILEVTQTTDFASFGANVCQQLVMSDAAIRAGDRVLYIHHNVDLATYPLVFQAIAEAGQMRLSVMNLTAGALDPPSSTFTVGYTPLWSVT